MTPELLDERLEEFKKRHQWEMDEWYEKFSTLHARLAKRAQRSKQPEPEPEELELDQHPSVIHLRRFGSV